MNFYDDDWEPKHLFLYHFSSKSRRFDDRRPSNWERLTRFPDSHNYNYESTWYDSWPDSFLSTGKSNDLLLLLVVLDKCQLPVVQSRHVPEQNLPTPAVLKRNLQMIIDVCDAKFETIAGKSAPSRATIFRMMEGTSRITPQKIENLAVNIQNELKYDITVADLSNPDLTREMVKNKKK